MSDTRTVFERMSAHCLKQFKSNNTVKVGTVSYCFEAPIEKPGEPTVATVYRLDFDQGSGTKGAAVSVGSFAISEDGMEVTRGGHWARLFLPSKE